MLEFLFICAKSNCMKQLEREAVKVKSATVKAVKVESATVKALKAIKV